MDLPQKGFTMAEYIWIDGHGGVRSKTKVRIILTVTRPYHPKHSLNAHALHHFSALCLRAKPMPVSKKRSYRTSGQQDKLLAQTSTLHGSGEGALQA